MTLLAIISEVSLYSRLNYGLSVDRIATVSGMTRRTVQKALGYLTDNGVIVRIVPPTEPGRRTPRAWIGLPWPPPTSEDAETTEAMKPSQTTVNATVDNKPMGGACDTHMGGACDTPSRSLFEKTPKELTRMAVCTVAHRRDGGRQVAALAVSVRERIPNVRTSTTWTEPDRPTPDPGRSAERQAMQREIDQRRDRRGPS